MRILFSVAAVAVVLTGCARKAEPVAALPPAPPPVAVPLAKPMPPSGASANVVLPPQNPDGSFATPNAALTPAATAWHLRAALNVAALRCNDPPMLANYNGFVRTHAAALKTAHNSSMKEAGGTDAFDDSMTRLYNYFALPPVQTAFCTAAAAVAEEAVRTPAAEFARFAGLSMPVLDAPFTNFFTRYAAYRTDLAAWQAGQAAPAVQVAQAAPAIGGVKAAPVAPAPRLAYDMAVMMVDPAPRRPGIVGGVAIAAR